jgi:two-component system chemotaxis sensor kinase CheA
MKIRMVPVEQLFRRFPRLVRDVAKACNKEVILQLAGEETDLDKSILDTLAEPLSHLVRNSVDHGIESVEQRVAAGKPPQGTIRLNAFHQGNQIVIECTDDGAGIDRYKLVSKAVEKGILTHDEAERMSDSEALHLIFHPGLSTATEVTAISGRGVGMDIVQSVIEQLKGTISIDSKPGVGTTFLLKVPLTLAIIKALMFRVSDRLYAIPLASVLEIARASASDVHRVDQHEVMQLRDQVLTLVRMEQLAKRGPLPVNKKIFVVVVGIADRKFGLIVDRLVGEEELVIKALDDHVVTTEFVSGASILGDGSVVLILNLPAVVARLGKAPALMEAVTA